MITEVIASAGLLVGIFSVCMNWRQKRSLRNEAACLRDEAKRHHGECLKQISDVGENLASLERNAQSNAELLRDGRLGMPARARALGLLRSGMSADSAAAELGIARNDVRLLEKVALLLAPRT
jgi:hypothetical protein